MVNDLRIGPRRVAGVFGVRVMSRIAASLLIVVAVLAMGVVFPQLGMAAEPGLRPAGGPEVRAPVESREGSRILALLVALEALQQQKPAPAAR
jgi:hypothetical protein